MRDIELLDTLQPPKRLRQLSQKLIEADIEDCNILQPADRVWEARSQPVVEENDLIEPRHVADARREAAVEVIVGEDDDRDRGIAEIVRDLESQPVVVDEDGVEVLVEEIRGDGAFELIESDVEVLEGWELEDDGGEFTGEAVVADVKLVEEMQLVEGSRECAAESIGVDVKE